VAIRLLIVDDSALMRRHLLQIFTQDKGFEVRIARDGQQAIDENLAWQPDVMTLDINMPVMDGITALAHIMASRPLPVVMVSSLTERGALATFEALALGAVDFVTKPDGTISLSIERIRHELIEKVTVASGVALKRHNAQRLTHQLRQERIQRLSKPLIVRRSSVNREIFGVVLIGVSTGGPSTLEDILPKLDADFPLPVIVAQHMPASFTAPFAARMNAQCALNVVEVNKPMVLAAGQIYIGKGGADTVIANRVGKLMVLPKPPARELLYHPSVEMLGRSVLEHCNAEHVIAVMLTGMGGDGAEAFSELKRQGAYTIAESEDSAVVFGMPKELIERGGAKIVLPADKIAAQMIRWAHDLEERSLGYNKGQEN